MPSVTRPRRAAVTLLVIALVAVLAGTAVAMALRPSPAPVAAAPPQAAAEAEKPAPAVITPTAIRLPAHPDVLVFGDSWTYGSAANPIKKGYAYVLAGLLGGRTKVEGVRGSGYVRPDRPDYATRISKLDPDAHYDLIILQGSINDRRMPAEGYREAVTAAWDALERIYPDTPVVVLGPAPQVLPVERATARIDRDLAALAADRQWWYISPVREKWITPENYHRVIDTSEIGRDHPTVAGHAYLAQRLAEALAEITDPSTSVEASEDDAAQPAAVR